MSKTAIVLCNLGGPDSKQAVEPFLFNLFNDKAIIGVPQPMRYFIAKMISRKRAPIAADIYDLMGGKSPIVENTKAQADGLQKRLGDEYKVFFVMRYWHPRSDLVAEEVKNYAPEKILFVPLYPQFSTTTTASSYKDFQEALKKKKISAPIQLLCCYPDQKDFIQAHVTLIKDALAQIKTTPRILFSAHGLPEKVIKAGDPYQWQVEKTVDSIVKALAMDTLDHITCYQSRVGPLKWIGPSTEEEIKRAGAEKKALMVVPVAFVSEHSETLVELDIEYRHLAESAGVTEYVRIPALGVQEAYISALANMCLAKDDKQVCSSQYTRICPTNFNKCPYAA